MSKQRAHLRHQRAIAEEAVRAARRRRLARRERVRAILQMITPRLSRRKTGRMLPRRSRAQRGGIAATSGMAIVLVWLYTDTMSTKIALSLFVLVATPVLVVLAFDRRI